jgi:hypothetical protein
MTATTSTLPWSARTGGASTSAAGRIAAARSTSTRTPKGGPATRNPVENVVFDQDPAPGTYRIVVDYFDRRDGPNTPYRVTIRREGQPDRVITGTAREGVREQVVGEFTVP